MKTKIKKFFFRLAKRQNITALGMIVAVGGISLALSFAAAGFARYKNLQLAKGKHHSAYEDELKKLSGITTNIESVPDVTASWKTYENQKYNFSVKHPQDWQAPKEDYPGPESNYLLKISFDAQENSKGKSPKGFDVFIYSSARFPSYLGTDSLVKKNGIINPKDCPHFDDITLGEAGYPATEINIAAGNPCYKETFFYSLTKNGFTYNIVPRFGNGYNIENYDEKINLLKVFPGFYDIVSTLSLAGKENIIQSSRRVVQKAIVPARAKYTAGGSCPNKHDHPSYSKTKGKHMDEDCCPDPDEWPNPRCAYSGGALGLMRSGPKK